MFIAILFIILKITNNSNVKQYNGNINYNTAFSEILYSKLNYV